MSVIAINVLRVLKYNYKSDINICDYISQGLGLMCREFIFPKQLLIIAKFPMKLNFKFISVVGGMAAKRAHTEDNEHSLCSAADRTLLWIPVSTPLSVHSLECTQK